MVESRTYYFLSSVKSRSYGLTFFGLLKLARRLETALLVIVEATEAAIID